MQTLKIWLAQYAPWMQVSNISFSIIDLIEILVLSFLVYTILVWIKNTRAWTLLKGIVFLIFFVVLIYLFQMDTLIFIIHKGISIAIIAVVIIFQPELRKALELLGERFFLINMFEGGTEKNAEQRCSDRTVNELIRATEEMAKVRTGALIVVEQNETLEEYKRTGIDLDAIVSSQLLINIFEHNTPLHDGAVLIRGDRILSATCYLPLTENQNLSKALGTRHRAGIGISEVTDSVTIIVSEETGKISIASRGVLHHNVNEEDLRAVLVALQNKTLAPKKGLVRMTFGRKRRTKKNEV